MSIARLVFRTADVTSTFYTTIKRNLAHDISVLFSSVFIGLEPIVVRLSVLLTAVQSFYYFIITSQN
jgi:hypothetical protein